MVFLPLKATAEIHDCKANITLKVWSEKDGEHLFTAPNLPVYELESEGYPKDVIDGTRREIEGKLKRGRLQPPVVWQ